MTYEMMAQLGAVVVICFIALLLVKAGIEQQKTLLDTNKEQQEEYLRSNKEITDSFKNTIDNHLESSHRCLKENLQGTRELANEVGKLRGSVRELSGQIKKNGGT